MTKISAEEARREFSSLLSRVQAGEEIIITRRGKDVVKLSAAVQNKGRFPDLTAFRNKLEQPKEGQETPSETVIKMRKDYRF